MFCTKYGGYIERSNLLASFRRLLHRAGLPKMRFHDLRHTAATILLEIGVNVKVVQELLGHENVTITLNIYAHVLPSMQQQAISGLERLFGDSDAD